MLTNNGIEDYNGRELAGTPTGDRLSTGLPAITGAQRLHLASRSLIHLVMPSWYLHIRQWLDHIREKGSRLAEWITNRVGAGLTPPQGSRLPIIMSNSIPTPSRPAILSPIWQRLADLIWLQRRGRKKNESLPRLLDADEGQLIDGQSTVPDEPYLNELLQALSATEEGDVAGAADRLYPSVINNPLLPPPGTMERQEFLPQALAISGYLPIEPLDEDTGGSAAPDISTTSRIPSIYQPDKIQKPGYLRVRNDNNRPAQANWLPHRIRQITHPADAIPVWYRSYLADVQERAEPDGQADQPLSLPYLPNIPEVIAQAEETIEALESYHQPVNLETGNTLLYSLPDRSEPTALSPILRRPSLSTIPRTKGRLEGLAFESMLPGPLIPSKDSGLLPTKVIPQQAPEISQAKWPVSLANLLPELARQKAGLTSIAEETDSMIYSQGKSTPIKPDSIGLYQQEGQAEEPLARRELPSFTSLYYQPSSIIGSPRQLSYMTESFYPLTLPVQQYFKPPEEVTITDRSEDLSFLEKEGYEPSPLHYEDTRQPALESLLTSVTGPRPGSSTPASERSSSERSSPAIFEGTAYYGGQPTPELAMAPVGRPPEAAPPVSAEPAEVKPEETAPEFAAIDMDALARDVYNKLVEWADDEVEFD